MGDHLAWYGPANVYLGAQWVCPDGRGNRACALHDVRVAFEGGFVHIDTRRDGEPAGRVVVKPAQAIEEINYRAAAPGPAGNRAREGRGAPVPTR